MASLNVTCEHGDTNEWTGYDVCDGYAHRIIVSDLDGCRNHAKNAGYEGILIGSPSVEWFQADYEGIADNDLYDYCGEQADQADCPLCTEHSYCAGCLASLVAAEDEYQAGLEDCDENIPF